MEHHASPRDLLCRRGVTGEMRKPVGGSAQQMLPIPLIVVTVLGGCHRSECEINITLVSSEKQRCQYETQAHWLRTITPLIELDALGITARSPHARKHRDCQHRRAAGATAEPGTPVDRMPQLPAPSASSVPRSFVGPDGSEFTAIPSPRVLWAISKASR